jgi:hypothetical protein
MSEDFEWIGRYNSRTGRINTSAPEPANLDDISLEDV